jgi:translocation and assembly module TamB
LPIKLPHAKAGKILLAVLAGLLLLLLVAWIALQRPAVQQRLAQAVTRSLSAKLGTRFEVGQVQLKFFKRAAIEGLYVEDLAGDTLLYARRLSAELGLFSFFGKKIIVKSFDFEGIRANLKRPAADSAFNFQFIIDAFASPELDTSAAENLWVFDLRQARLRDARLLLSDSLEQYLLEARIGDFSVVLDEFDLAAQRLAIGRTTLEGSIAHYESWAPPAATTPAPLAFPYPGWDIRAKQLRWADNEFIFKNRPAPSRPGEINYADLHLTGLALEIAGFDWQASLLAGTIEQLAFAEQSGFALSGLRAAFKATEQEISLRAFELTTPHSQVRSELALRFADFQHMAKGEFDAHFSPTRLALQDVQYLTGALTAFPYFSPPSAPPLEIEGQCSGTLGQLELAGLKLAWGEALRMQLDGRLHGLPVFEQLQFELALQELSTGYEALARQLPGLALPAGLAELGRLQLSGRFRGSLADWQGEQLRLETQAATRFAGNLRVQGMTDIDKAVFDLQAEELATLGQDWAGFLGGEVPPQLARLGLLVYQGALTGTIRDFRLLGQLQTELGRIEQDLRLAFNADYSNADYDGQLELHRLDLGRLLAAPEQYGAASLSARIDGRGLGLDSLSARVVAQLHSLEFNGYEYCGLELDGQFDRRQFDGSASLDDEQLAFRFLGSIDLNDSLPVFRFAAELDTVKLDQLNLYPHPLALSFRLEADLQGNTLDNLAGTAALSRLHLSSDSLHFGPENIRLLARQEAAGRKVLRLKSDLAQAEINGFYQLENLPRLLAEFTDQYFPLAPRDTAAREPLAGQAFHFYLDLSNPARLGRLFAPALTRFDTAFIEGYFNSAENQLALDGAVPVLRYGGLSFDSIRLQAYSEAGYLRSNLRVGSICSGSEEIIPPAALELALGGDSLQFLASVTEREGAQRLRIAGAVTPQDENYRLALASPLVLDQQNWVAAPGNHAIFGPGALLVQQLRFEHNGQAFYAQSQLSKQDTSAAPAIAPLEIGFERFQLGAFSALAGLEEGFLEGQLDGTALLSPVDSSWHYAVALAVSQLQLDRTELGTLRFNAQSQTPQEILQLSASLEGAAPRLQTHGTYHRADGTLALQVALQELRLSLLDGLLPGYTRDSEGSLSAELAISGSITRPVVEGQIGLHGISTFIQYLQGRYAFTDHTITLKPRAIELGQLQVRDQAGALATLSGQIQHEHFEQLRFQLQASAKQFQFLNTTARDNPLFYGRLLLDTDVRISGTPSLPVVTIDARTLPRTRLTAQALSSEAALVQEDYIFYGPPPPADEGDTLSPTARPAYRANTEGIQLTLNLEVNPEAVFEAIIDPETGDKLSSRGRGNLTVKMDPAGNLSTTGTYTITEGSYALNYQNIVQRTFTIRPGSRIELLGDPLDSRFDITAVYTSRTTPYLLIARQVELSPLMQKRRGEARVLLQLKGELAKPEITFDLEIPPTGNAELDEALGRKLAQLRDQPNDLNLQVFGLIFFNSFIVEDKRPASLANTGENLVLSSVSSLISQQLNVLAQRYLRGVELTVDLDSYRTAMADGDATVAEVNVQLSKRLFDDRLSIQVGGNLDVAGSRSNEEDLSNLAGDFLLEYQLTEDGRYRLRVFSRSHFDILNQNNNYRTGIGLMYKKSYGLRRRGQQ